MRYAYMRRGGANGQRHGGGRDTSERTSAIGVCKLDPSEVKYRMK
jgi:hypothetical protein